MIAIALAGALAVALGGVVAAIEGRLRTGPAAQAAGMAALGAAGARVLLSGETLGAGWHDGFSPPSGSTR